MSAPHKCLCIDGPCKGQEFELHGYEPRLQRRDRQGSKHWYRFSGGQGETWHFIYDDPAHVAPPNEPDRCCRCRKKIPAHHSKLQRHDGIVCINCDRNNETTNKSLRHGDE